MKIKTFIEKSIVSNLYTTHLLFSNLLEKSLKRSGLTYVEAVILTSLLFENEKENIGPSRLSNVLGLSKARVSKALTRLMLQGLIRRELVVSDSRKFKIKLEPSGERKATQIVKIFDLLESQIETSLGGSRSSSFQKDLVKLSKALGYTRRE